MLALIIIAVLVLCIFVSCIKVVPQAKAYVIERLGAYQATWNVGLHLKIPFIDKVARKVNLKEQVADRYRSLLSDHRSQAVHLRRREPYDGDRESDCHHPA